MEITINLLILLIYYFYYRKHQSIATQPLFAKFIPHIIFKVKAAHLISQKNAETPKSVSDHKEKDKIQVKTQ